VGVRLLIALAAAGALLGLGLAGGSRADNGQLVGDVGAGDSFQISLKDASGAAVKHLDPGTYTLLVHDRSALHNFDLSGPGVNVVTDIGGIGDQTFTITLTDGTYLFQCDAHSAQMRGSFTVGSVTSTTTTTPAPTPSPAATKLNGAIGPGARLSLRPTSGLSAGKFKLTVSDRSAVDGFKLSGPGISRATGVKFTGTTTWTLSLKAGNYTYVSVKHPKAKRTFRVSSS
jgi:hypothetical protein